MPDVLKLDPDTERLLQDCIAHDTALGRFQLGNDKVLVLDKHSGDPGRSSLAKTLEEKFSFIDVENGGLKIGEIDIAGRPARFTLVPRWEAPPPGTKGLGGPSIGLRFSMHF
jgi:hypothetical protein